MGRIRRIAEGINVEVGQIVVKLNGRFAGRAAVVTDVGELNKGYVVIAIPYAKDKVKKKRSNVKHVLPLNKKIKITGKEEGKELWANISKEKMEEFFVKRIKI